MRYAIFIWALFAVLTLPGGEIYFVPGWYSGWKSYSKHQKMLQEIFPEDTIFIRKWDSNRLWENAKNGAAGYALELAGELEKRNTAEVTVIGHSLGGRIALDCAAYFAGKNKPLRQIILLGTAGELSAEDIRNCQKISVLPVINIYCPDDNMLKLFLKKEGRYPVGLVGLPRPEKHFEQYRMLINDQHIRVFQIPVIHRRTAEPFRETAAHLSPHYLRRLGEVIGSRDGQMYVDLPALETEIAAGGVEKDYYPGFFRIDEFDGWKLYHRHYPERFRIDSPTGRKFYFTSETAAKKHFDGIKLALTGK